MKNLFFAVHPDDETLGAGGTILRFRGMGDENFWCILTNIGESATFAHLNETRTKEIDKVGQKYGFKKIYHLPFETMGLDTYSMTSIINELTAIINQVQPDRIFIPYKYDAHSDHKRAYTALSPFLKTFRYPSIKEVYCMETISETDITCLDSREVFVPNAFFDITSTFSEKCEIMKIYSSELGNHPFPRSLRTIEAQALLRGSQAGVEYAEAFMLIKKIN